MSTHQYDRRLFTNKIAFLIAFCFISNIVSAQLNKYPLDGKKTMRFALYHGSLTNEWFGKVEDEKYSTVVFDWSQSKSTFGQWKYQNSHRYKILGDLISLIYSGPGIGEAPPAGTPYLTSIVGWHNFAFSVLHNQYVQFSGGLHAGDYIYGIEGLHSDKDSDKNTSGSSYYYGAIGPAWMADVAIGATGFWLHYEGSYAFTFGKEPLEVAPDVKPNLLNQSFELRWRHVFVNVEVVYGLNDWGNRIRRQQFGAGISL